MREKLYSINGKKVRGSTIRKLLKYKSDDAYFFAGGLPANELFPKQQLLKISKEVLISKGNITLQYGSSLGYPPLREYLINRMKNKGIFFDNDEVIITSGAQQAIELCLKLFINRDDGIVAEDPTFISSLNNFQNFSEYIYPVHIDSDGMNMNILEQTLRQNPRIKMLYTISNFHNPTGIVTSLEKRKTILGLAERYDLIIVEDDPYGEIRFSGEDIPTIKALDNNSRVIYVSSFSKIFSPGIRVGWIVANKELIDKFGLFKQMDDVHTSMLSQMFLCEYLNHYDLDSHVKKTQALYRKKSTIMVNAIEKYFPKECKYIYPQGGLFIWCFLMKGYNSENLLKRCIKKKVIFVPGSTFMHDYKKPCNCFRLNYSNAEKDKIDVGIKILGQVMKEMFAN